MLVAEAVRKAKTYVSEIYQESGEKISDIGLEEVNKEEEIKKWNVTIGFTRPFRKKLKNKLLEIQNNLAMFDALEYKREYKIVEINDENGEVIALKSWPAN